MKYLKLSIVLIAFCFVGCNDDCTTSEIETCQETVPTDELCEAYFERWFYNSESSTCEMIGYSGCNQWGFATEEECDACKCD